MPLFTSLPLAPEEHHAICLSEAAAERSYQFCDAGILPAHHPDAMVQNSLLPQGLGSELSVERGMIIRILARNTKILEVKIEVMAAGNRCVLHRVLNATDPSLMRLRVLDREPPDDGALHPSRKAGDPDSGSVELPVPAGLSTTEDGTQFVAA